MSKPKILIVDDSRDDIDLITITLEQEGYDILSATDGLEGLDLCKAGA